MMLRLANGAVVVLDRCHWTEGAYLSLTHAGGAGTVLDVEAIDAIAAELDRIKLAILTRRAAQRNEQAA